MIYLQFIVLLIMLSFLLILERNTLASPSIICLAVFTISTLFAAAYKNKWDYDYSADAFLWILGLLVLFCIIELIIDYFSRNINGYGTISYGIKNDELLEVSNGKIIFLVIAMAVMTIIYYRLVNSLSIQYGNRLGGLWRVIYYSRQAQVHGNMSLPYGASLMSSICRDIAYFFLYILIHNRVIYHEKIRMKYIVPILMWLPISVLTGGRTSYIYFVAFGIVSFLVVYQKTYTINDAFITKFVMRLIPIFIAFLLLFNFVGRLKVSGVDQSPLDHIAKYVGFSIPGFSYFLRDGWTSNTYFGQTTLNRIYSITNTLGITNIQTSSRFLPFIRLPGGEESNIYTAFARYLNDFGAFGTIFIIIVMAIFYGIYKNAIFKSNTSNLQIMLYASFIWPLSLISIEENFLNELVSTTSIYMLIIFCILNKFLFGKK